MAEPAETSPPEPSRVPADNELGHPSPLGMGSAPKPAAAMVDRRFAVAAAVLGFGIGLALGLKLASGMPKAIAVEVPAKVPCRSCAERERRAQEAAAAAKANGAPVIPVEGEDPLPTEQRPITFSTLEGAPSDMVAAATVPTPGYLPPDQTE